MTFPAGALFTIFAGMIRMKIELRAKSDFQQKNNPTPQRDIGIWMDLLDFLSNLSIFVCSYIVVFTSQELTKNAPFEDATMYILAFSTMHFIFVVKFVLAEIIDDEPAWIGEDAENVANRVDQVEKDNRDKKLIEYLSKHFSEVDLLFEVLKKQHKDLT